MNKFINLALFALFAGLNTQTNCINTSTLPTCPNRNAASCLNSYALMLFINEADVNSWLQSDASNPADYKKTTSLIQTVQQNAQYLNNSLAVSLKLNNNVVPYLPDLTDNIGNIQNIQQENNAIINNIKTITSSGIYTLTPNEQSTLQTIINSNTTTQTLLQATTLLKQLALIFNEIVNNSIKSFNQNLVNTLNSWCEPNSNQWLSKSQNCNTFNNHIKPNFLPNA